MAPFVLKRICSSTSKGQGLSLHNILRCGPGGYVDHVRLLCLFSPCLRFAFGSGPGVKLVLASAQTGHLLRLAKVPPDVCSALLEIQHHLEDSQSATDLVREMRDSSYQRL